MTAYPTPAAAALVRHEVRRCGLGVRVLPVAGAAAGAAAGVVPAAAHPVVSSASGTALAGLAALCVVAMLGRERMLELQSALPVPLPLLVARRLAVVAVSAAVAGACTGAAALAAAAAPPGALGVMAAVASAAAPLLATSVLLAGTALSTWTRWRSAAAASGALVAVWLGHGLLWAPNVPTELNLPVSAAAGAVLIWRGLRSLADPEHIVTGEAR